MVTNPVSSSRILLELTEACLLQKACCPAESKIFKHILMVFRCILCRTLRGILNPDGKRKGKLP